MSVNTLPVRSGHVMWLLVVIAFVAAGLSWLIVTVKTPIPLVPTALGSATNCERTPVFSAGFADAARWTAGRSSAYPRNGPTNRGDAKLDWIAPTNRPDDTGLLDATRRTDGYWNADLVTTEYSVVGFRVRTGDAVTAIVTLPRASDAGAWPAIWTWGSGTARGHGEVDLFEWHNDHPYMLELSNHVGGGTRYADKVVQPGVPFDLRVDLLAGGVTWWVNGLRVFVGGGLPADWSAYLIVNLSVSDGTWHPAPAVGATRLAYRVNALRVWR